MTRSSFAPELSATLSRVSCWTICLLSRLRHDLDDAPPLFLGQRTRLRDAHEVADAALVLLVVDLELGALAHRLAVEAVGFRRAHLDDDRLVHLVGDDVAQPDLAPAAGFRGSRRSGGGVAHSASSFLARPRPRLGFVSSATASSGSAAASVWASGSVSTSATATAESSATAGP